MARNKKILFTEGSLDYKILRRFAKKFKLTELASGNDITQLASEGYSSWSKVQALAWGLKNTLDSEIKIAAIYDRDFWCDNEIIKVEQSLKGNLSFAHVHRRKEIENYLLVPSVLTRCINKTLSERANRVGEDYAEIDAIALLHEITNGYQTILQGQYIAKYFDFHRSTGKDQAVLTTEALQFFNEKWNNLDSRMEIVAGKEVLRELRTTLSKNYSITLTDFKIIDEFKVPEIPADLTKLLTDLEEYRRS